MSYTGVPDLFDEDGKIKTEKLPTSQTATVTKESVEAVLTGEIDSHSHASSGGLTQAQILTRQL